MSSFVVNIKINAAEAERRLRGLKRKLGMGIDYAGTLLRLIDRDGELRNEITKAKHQINLTVEALGEVIIGERQYLADTILATEASFDKCQRLLLTTEYHRQKGTGMPAGLYLRASCLATSLRAERSVLYRMRMDMEKETFEAAAQPDMARAFRGRSVEAAEEHHNREHLFSNGWHSQPRSCACLSYE